MADKTLELYFFYDDEACDWRVSNAMPRAGDRGITQSDDAIGMEICDAGRKMFGLGGLADDEVAKVTLSITSIAKGKHEVKVEFKPFVEVKAARRRRRRT